MVFINPTLKIEFAIFGEYKIQVLHGDLMHKNKKYLAIQVVLMAHDDTALTSWKDIYTNFTYFYDTSTKQAYDNDLAELLHSANFSVAKTFNIQNPFEPAPPVQVKTKVLAI